MNKKLNNIKLLREETGLPILECKKALDNSNHDLKNALVELKKIFNKKILKIHEKNNFRRAGVGRFQ